MESHEAQWQLEQELRKTLSRCMKESQLTHYDIIAVFEILKLSTFHQALKECEGKSYDSSNLDSPIE